MAPAVCSQRYISSTGGDTLTFSLTNASAFVLSGVTKENRYSLEVTITPPQDEGPPRTHFLTDMVPVNDLHYDAMHYFEAGLNRSSMYTVTLTNPALNVTGNVLDLRYVRIIDAPPTRYVAVFDDHSFEKGSHPFFSAPSSSVSDDNSESVSPGAIAGIVVRLSIITCVAVF